MNERDIMSLLATPAEQAPQAMLHATERRWLRRLMQRALFSWLAALCRALADLLAPFFARYQTGRR